MVKRKTIVHMTATPYCMFYCQCYPRVWLWEELAFCLVRFQTPSKCHVRVAWETLMRRKSHNTTKAIVILVLKFKYNLVTRLHSSRRQKLRDTVLLTFFIAVISWKSAYKTSGPSGRCVWVWVWITCNVPDQIRRQTHLNHEATPSPTTAWNSKFF